MLIKKPKSGIISVITPCFNEEENLLELYSRLKKVFRKISQKYEIIFVNNGSTDHSLEILKSLVVKDSGVTVISYSRNFGPPGAYSGGLVYTRGDAVICIDADLQDPPELIAKMIDKWREGFDVVYGVRKNRKGSKLRKLLTLAYYRILNKLSFVHIPLDAGDFSLMDRKVVDLINAMPEHNKYFTGIRAWVGFSQYGIDYDRLERNAGVTKFSIIDYVRWAAQSIFSFSYKPLELISYLAILVVFLTILGILVYILDFFFYPNNPRGFITLILIILFLGGVQLLCLSIIGQYLANIFEEVKNRPPYVIKEVLHGKNQKRPLKSKKVSRMHA